MAFCNRISCAVPYQSFQYFGLYISFFDRNATSKKESYEMLWFFEQLIHGVFRFSLTLGIYSF